MENKCYCNHDKGEEMLCHHCKCLAVVAKLNTQQEDFILEQQREWARETEDGERETNGDKDEITI